MIPAEESARLFEVCAPSEARCVPREPSNINQIFRPQQPSKSAAKATRESVNASYIRPTVERDEHESIPFRSPAGEVNEKRVSDTFLHGTNPSWRASRRQPQEHSDHVQRERQQRGCAIPERFDSPATTGGAVHPRREHTRFYV